MNSKKRGTTTSACEVTSIERNGFWLLIDNREYFVPFSAYPMFRRLSVGDIQEVKRIGRDQLRWESHDIDIELAALENPREFPLLAPH